MHQRLLGGSEYYGGCPPVSTPGTLAWGLHVVLSIQFQSLLIHTIPHLKLLSPKHCLITLTISVPEEAVRLGLLQDHEHDSVHII